MVYQIGDAKSRRSTLLSSATRTRNWPNYHIGKVLLVQPKNWAISLARLDFQMQKAADGHWTVARKDSRVDSGQSRRRTADDEADSRIGKPYHEITERYLNTGVAESAKALDSTLGRVEDTALMDAIQQVQLYYSKADVSFASLFNQRVSVPKGPVTVRQIAALYVYDNELYAIEGTGKMVKDALENSARYFRFLSGESCATPPLTNPRVLRFQLRYGRRRAIRNRPDAAGGRPDPESDVERTAAGPGQKLRIAVNNYRAAGSAGYSMFVGAKIVWQSMTEIRDLMIQYYTERKQLPVGAGQQLADRA